MPIPGQLDLGPLNEENPEDYNGFEAVLDPNPDEPLLILAEDPADTIPDGGWLLIRHRIVAAVAVATDEALAAELGEDVGIDGPLYSDLLMDDETLIETFQCQHAADSELARQIQTRYPLFITTYDQRVRSGQVGRFRNDLEGFDVIVKVLSVSRTLEATDGITDIMQSKVDLDVELGISLEGILGEAIQGVRRPKRKVPIKIATE